MMVSNLITSTLDYAALAYTHPPFALVKVEVSRTEGYVVVMRSYSLMKPHEIARGLLARFAVPWILLAAPYITTSILHVTSEYHILSRDSAEALFADVCADLRSGGASMRQWSEELPFQIVLARARLRDITPYTFDVVPVLYASGPRWRPTKERPADDTP